MSRSQQSDVIKTASTNTETDRANAKTALADENTSISDYEKQLGEFAAKDPYAEGGAYDTNTDKIMAANADAGSDALTNLLQTQAQRTGQNAGASIATAAEASRQGQRDMATGEAQGELNRVAGEAGYGKEVLDATAVPAGMRADQYKTALASSTGNLGIQADASKTPGFWDTLGDSFAQQLGKTAAGGNLSLSKQI